MVALMWRLLSKYQVIFPMFLSWVITLQPVRAQLSDSSIIKLADPAIFYHDNMYYLYGTVGGNSNAGFLVYRSADLQHWTLSTSNHGFALKKGDAFGRSGFWAPQVFGYNGKFYMAYVANEQIAIATSDHPGGPFVQHNKDSLPSITKQIDPYVFIDEDGQKYLYHVRLREGNRIYVAKINDDFTAIDTSTLRECIAAEEGWENTENATWPVAEGPTVFRHRDTYYLFYSANDFRNPDYAVGYATSEHPLGPWKKFMGNPVLNRAVTGTNGTGHGDFFHRKKRWYYVFHTHNNNSTVAPRKTAIIPVKFKRSKKDPDKVYFDKNGFRFLINGR
jgi:xylan 1,4-beta-xylosidase